MVEQAISEPDGFLIGTEGVEDKQVLRKIFEWLFIGGPILHLCVPRDCVNTELLLNCRWS